MSDFEQQLQTAQNAWLKEMEGFIGAFGAVEFPIYPTLTERHLENCRVLPNREAILQRMRIGGVVAEVGVQTGRFSQSILNICHPSKLHLLDLNLAGYGIPEKFHAEISAGIVHLHPGDSSSILQTFPDEYFDFIYIDGDHSYEGVKRDIEAAKSKINNQGILIFNDYTFWSPVECMKYGVIQAVNELCLAEDWEVLYFSFAHYMYCDVAIKKRH
jgi:hypothetical protein